MTASSAKTAPARTGLFDADAITWIEGGISHVGTSRPEIREDGEYPIRKTKLAPFGMARFAVTNAQFAAFVDATGYVSDAHRLGWSYVFRGLLEEASGPQPEGLPWWNGVDGASWDRPLGPGSDWRGVEDHPVVHVSFHDAVAFAEWAGGRVPSEAEWEHAARGGPQEARYPRGEAEPDDDAIFCNIWQGAFPEHNAMRDGYYGTCPVDAFEPNRYGLYNQSGNVWEWVADRFRVRSLGKSAKARNADARRDDERVLKGGSFLCHRSTCWRYRVAARSGRQPDNGSSNVGFRLAFDP